MAPQPEQQARVNIDALLQAAGWHVCAAAANIHASQGVAIRGFPLKSGHSFADYLLLVDRGNLADQTLKEFQQYVSPYSNFKFSEEYIVQRLQGNQIDTTSEKPNDLINEFRTIPMPRIAVTVNVTQRVAVQHAIQCGDTTPCELERRATDCEECSGEY